MYYFASDVHLGLPVGDPQQRERLFVRWLDEVAPDAEAIFLVGDIFDFWYEYRRVVPKGFTRLLGKLAELTDRGIPIHFFTGNHDLWAFDYLRSECGVVLHREPYTILTLAGMKVCIAHGDVVGPRNLNHRFQSALFRARWVQGLFSLLHPDLALWLGQRWSRHSRRSKPLRHTFRGEEELAVGFAREMLRKEPIDLFVCGHIHLSRLYLLGPRSCIAFLGEWVHEPGYGELGPAGFKLKQYPNHE